MKKEHADKLVYIYDAVYDLYINSKNPDQTLEAIRNYIYEQRETLCSVLDEEDLKKEVSDE